MSWETRGGGGGDTLPVVDTTALVKDPSDATKRARIDVGGVDPGNTAVITVTNSVDLSPSAGSFLPYNEAADLLSTLTPAADRVPYYTGPDASGLAVFTAAGRALLDDADAAAQRVTLSLDKRIIAFYPFGPTEAAATGDGKISFRVPSSLNGWNIVGAVQFAPTAGTTGTQDTQLRRVRSGTPVDVFSTKLTLDSTEPDSSTAATPVVINASNDDLATGDILYYDQDAVQGTPAQGTYMLIEVEKP